MMVTWGWLWPRAASVIWMARSNWVRAPSKSPRPASRWPRLFQVAMSGWLAPRVASPISRACSWWARAAARSPSCAGRCRGCCARWPVPANGSVAVDLEVGPAEFAFDLLVALLDQFRSPTGALPGQLSPAGRGGWRVGRLVGVLSSTRRRGRSRQDRLIANSPRRSAARVQVARSRGVCGDPAPGHER
jgi:hypothetical protein